MAPSKTHPADFIPARRRMHRWSFWGRIQYIPLLCHIGGPFLDVAGTKRKHGVETCRPRRRGSLKFSICEKRSSQCALFITAKTSVRKWRFFPTTLIIGHKIDGGHLSSFSNTPSAREAIAIHCPCHCPFLDHLPTYRLPSSPLPTVFLQPCGDFGCCGLCGCTRTLL